MVICFSKLNLSMHPFTFLFNFFFCEDNAAGQVQYTDSGDHNSIPPLDQIDVDGNRPVLPVPTPSVYVGCLSRFGGFLANIKRVYSIFRVGCTVISYSIHSRHA